MEHKKDSGYKKLLFDLRQDQAGRFDTLLTSLSSGALAATFFLGKETAWGGSMCGFILWALACLFFALSLSTVLFSFLESLAQIERALETGKTNNKSIKKSRERGVLFLFVGIIILFCYLSLNFYLSK